jgi:hypothetical protein
LVLSAVVERDEVAANVLDVRDAHASQPPLAKLAERSTQATGTPNDALSRVVDDIRECEKNADRDEERSLPLMLPTSSKERCADERRIEDEHALLLF